MRKFLACLLALMIPASTAMAKPYFLTGAVDDMQYVDFIDNATITPTSGNVYRYKATRVYNGPGIKRDVKYSVSTIELDCDRSTLWIVDARNHDAQGGELGYAEGTRQEIQITPQNYAYHSMQFICAGDERTALFEDRKIAEHLDLIGAVDRVYQNRAADPS